MCVEATKPHENRLNLQAQKLHWSWKLQVHSYSPPMALPRPTNHSKKKIHHSSSHISLALPMDLGSQLLPLYFCQNLECCIFFGHFTNIISNQQRRLHHTPDGKMNFIFLRSMPPLPTLRMSRSFHPFPGSQPFGFVFLINCPKLYFMLGQLSEISLEIRHEPPPIL